MRPELARKKLFAKTTRPSGDAGCWLWRGGVDPDGYGYTGGALGERRAHRAAWVATNGPIPAGMFVCHRCDVPACINPAHLFLGTPADNMKDRHSKGRYARGADHHARRRPETVCRGENHPHAKLTAAQVADIRATYAPKYGALTAMAKRYGVTPGAIWRVVHNLNHAEGRR